MATLERSHADAIAVYRRDVNALASNSSAVDSLKAEVTSLRHLVARESEEHAIFRRRGGDEESMRRRTKRCNDEAVVLWFRIHSDGMLPPRPEVTNEREEADAPGAAAGGVSAPRIAGGDSVDSRPGSPPPVPLGNDVFNPAGDHPVFSGTLATDAPDDATEEGQLAALTRGGWGPHGAEGITHNDSRIPSPSCRTCGLGC